MDENIKELVEIGLDEGRFRKHTAEEISLALCAVQESGKDLENIEHLGDVETAVLYAESALGW